MTLKLIDTRSRQKSDFQPQTPGHVHIYVCGMTVQGPPHIGHLRGAVVADMARRYLLHVGYEVTLVHNFTDVDDKIIARAMEEGLPPAEIAERNIVVYEESLEKIGVMPPTVAPKVSEHIPEIIALIQDLIDKGHAYPAPNGDVYFAVRSYPPYGQLSGRRVDELIAGSRIEVGEDKKEPEDFALWKASKPGEPAWPSPWGEGRPGWHIECSAMAMRYCGHTLDMHGGGVDLIFPHHENEVAQSQASTGQPFVANWIHHGMVNLAGEKMSKSTNHFFLATDVFASVDPIVVRYYLMTTHFRSPIEFSEERLAEAKTALGRLFEFVQSGAGAPADAAVSEPLQTALLSARQQFMEALADDLNSARALGYLFELMREVHKLAGGAAEVPYQAAVTVRELLAILGLEVPEAGQDEVPEEALALLEARNAARLTKNWADADAFRDQLAELGFVIEDRPGGSVLKKTS